MMKHYRMPRKASYAADGAIDAAIAYSVSSAAPAALLALKQEAVRARRTSIALSVLLMRLSIIPGKLRLSRRAELSSLKMRVSETLRHTDTVGPYDEDGVLAVLPGAELTGAEAAAKRLVEAHNRRPQAKCLVFEIGAAALGPAESNLTELVQRAADNLLSVEEDGDLRNAG